MMGAMDGTERIDALKALGHPLRLRIVEVLAKGERNVTEIERDSGIGQPTLSQQLAVLRKSSLVRTRKEAKLVFYRLDKVRLAEIAAGIAALAGQSPMSTVSRERTDRSPQGVASFARLS